MNFFGYDDVKKHPLASMIPQEVWIEVFKGWISVSDFTIELMDTPNEQLKRKLCNRHVKRDETWMAIALSHPTMSNRELIEIGMYLRLDYSDLLDLAVMLGDSPKNLELLKMLSEQEPYSNTLFENYSLRIQRAALGGHIKTLTYLIDNIKLKASDKGEVIDLCSIISQRDYAAFRNAAGRGHLEILEYLEELAPHKIAEMIAAQYFHAMQSAAMYGHMNVLKYLDKKQPGKLQDKIYDSKFLLASWAASGGHLDVLKFFEEKITNDLFQRMIEANDFSAFKGAARFGKLDVLMYLKEKTSGPLKNRLEEQIYPAFVEAADKKQYEVMHYLLSHANTSTFARIEAHEEYGENCVWLFVMQKINAFRVRQQETEARSLDAVFDVASPDEARFLFYIARNLIRRNDAGCIDDLRFLLNIPSVKALAHTEVTPYQSNELLRLALSVGNQGAASLLLNIPAVRTLAEQNDYYRREQHGQLNLHALAADRESSMTALTQGEQQQLQAVTNRYQPLLKQAGAAQVMNDLRATLQAYYEAHPATITIQKNGHSHELILPMAWNDFTSLHLDPIQTAQAFKAYYQNKAHTAWRYLSKPNSWMHEHASYIYINDTRTERWSTFEEYQSLISLLYLAVIDKDTPCIDEYTLETRLEHFIDELAHIGRAHNWDQSRYNQNNKLEQYDDLEGDRPSCFSGVKRRLFQSVLGHPLLKLVTGEVIKAEINEFLVAHFKKAINSSNGGAIKEVWDKGIDGEALSEKDTKIIQNLNVSSEQQQDFKNYLSKKYGSSFATNLILINLVDKAFELTPTLTSHLFKHGGLMMEFFDKLQVSAVPVEHFAQNPNRLFATRASQAQNDETPLSELTPR
ncbi:ankyrin repeat protein [Legionella santicrucis]|uniref:Ankyrin repeat protein n=1 Tax=Legionella santicrucis TaxID=45074 RepID=A0A0W0ZL02_9GAMM|nr:hypothetical protein [Legionella santicrucis]KTD69777.1 ankyrin repeat protein [Legionella santicrucis]